MEEVSAQAASHETASHQTAFSETAQAMEEVSAHAAQYSYLTADLIEIGEKLAMREQDLVQV